MKTETRSPKRPPSDDAPQHRRHEESLRLGEPVMSVPALKGTTVARDKCCFVDITLVKVKYTSNLRSRNVQWQGDVIVGGVRRKIGPYDRQPQRNTILYNDKFVSDEVGYCPGLVAVRLDLRMEALGMANPFEHKVVENEVVRFFRCPTRRATLVEKVAFVWEKADQDAFDRLPLGPEVIAKAWSMPLGATDPAVTFEFYFSLALVCRNCA